MENKNYTIKELKQFARQDLNWKTLLPISFLVIITPVIFSLLYNIHPVIGVILSILSFIFTLEFSAVQIYNFIAVKRNNETVNIFGKFNKVLPYLGYTILILLMCMPLYILSIGGLTYGFIESDSKIILAAGILLIVAFILMIYITLHYFLSPYLIVDKNMGAIKSLKESRHLMKGKKKKALLLTLSFIGWIMLASLFIAVLVAGIGTFPTLMLHTVSKIGIGLNIINSILITSIVLLPLSMYINMAYIEFYEETINNSMNPIKEYKTNKKIIIWTTVISLCLAFISAGSLCLPIAATPVPSDVIIMNNVVAVDKGSISTTNTIDDDYIDTNESSNGIIDKIESKIEEKNEVKPGQEPDFSIKYTVPNGYKFIKESSYSGKNYKSSYYAKNDEDFIIVLATGEANYNLEDVIDKSSEKDHKDYETKSGVKGQTFVSTLDDSYSFRFIHNKYLYTINSNDEDVLHKVIDSIK